MLLKLYTNIAIITHNKKKKQYFCTFNSKSIFREVFFLIFLDCSFYICLEKITIWNRLHTCLKTYRFHIYFVVNDLSPCKHDYTSFEVVKLPISWVLRVSIWYRPMPLVLQQCLKEFLEITRCSLLATKIFWSFEVVSSKFS